MKNIEVHLLVTKHPDLEGLWWHPAKRFSNFVNSLHMHQWAAKIKANFGKLIHVTYYLLSLVPFQSELRSDDPFVLDTKAFEGLKLAIS